MDTKLVKKSRKEYRCTYCEETISKETAYLRVTITPWSHYENDSFDLWRIHEDCYALGNKYYYDDADQGIFPDSGLGKDFLKYKQSQKENVCTSQADV